jgi:hypothetical protein
LQYGPISRYRTLRNTNPCIDAEVRSSGCVGVFCLQLNYLNMKDFKLINGKKYPILQYPTNSKTTKKCPYCNQKHIHSKYEGHRISHCTDQYDKYGKIICFKENLICILKDNTVVTATDGYYIEMT